MKEYFYDFLVTQGVGLSQRTILINFALAIVIGMVIYFAYQFSHTGAVYSARFNLSLVMLTVITTLVMTVIGSNIALSLGMVGALSIVRFRTAIKDPRDTAFIFWSIATGICCGVSEYFVAGVGSAILFILLLIFGRIQTNDRYLLIVRGDREKEEKIEALIEAYYRSKAKARVKNTNIESVEFIYEISRRLLEQSQKAGGSITNKLYELEGIQYVNLVCQNDEVNG
ncbi:DUF4956 domain-containing protein [Gottschalkiaceae bacterium SANA]|nr:DUF4956 domain-containing protein [Gottschalkiaceae bacterium SANA]